MIEVETIDAKYVFFDSVCIGFRQGAYALARSNRQLAKTFKLGILSYFVGDCKKAKRVFDDPEFDYWLLRIGNAVRSEHNYLIVDNLRLFSAWLFVKVNQ